MTTTPREESPFLTMQREIQAATDRGVDVISFLMGEPDFRTPAHIADAAIAAIQAGDTRYTAMDGTRALKSALAAKFERDSGLTFAAEELVVTNGGTQGLFNLLAATVRPGDEVVVPAPFFPPYIGAVQFAGGKPVVVATRAEKGFVLQAEQLCAAITPATRWLLLNSPNNPSGAVAGENDLKALAAVLREAPHVGVVSDEIYEAIVFDGHKAVSLLQVAPDLRDRVLILNGVSKTHAMTGWRIGYAAGPRRWIEAIAQVCAISTFTPNAVSQAAAAEALRGDQRHVEVFRASYEARRNLLLQRLQAMPGVSCEAPRGAFYLFPSCAALLGGELAGQRVETDMEFCTLVLREAGVAMMPGSAFGMPGFFRLSYAIAPDQITAACDRLQSLLT